MKVRIQVMKYLYKIIILASIMIACILIRSLLALTICYFLLLIFQTLLYKNIYELSRKKANIFLTIIVVAWFFIGLYHKDIYESLIRIPAIILVLSQSLVLTVYPYSLNLKKKYSELENGTKEDRSKIEIIRRNNLIIRIIVIVLIITVFILGIFL